MNDPQNYVIELTNGWTAKYKYRGEFKMACEGWGLKLYKNSKVISSLENEVILINDFDGLQANNNIFVSLDGNFGLVLGGMGNQWVVDFSGMGISVYYHCIQHNRHGKYVSVREYPAYKNATHRIEFPKLQMYLTFPFINDELFEAEYKKYLIVRSKQIDELYFSE